MEDILVDKEIDINKKRPIFSQIAFLTSMLTVFLLIILVIAYIAKKTKIWEIQLIFKTRVLLLTVILGFAFSIIAIIKKEKLKYLKLIGAVINFIFFAFFMAAVVSVLIDWKKYVH